MHPSAPHDGDRDPPRDGRPATATAVAVPLLALGLLAAAVWLGAKPPREAGDGVKPSPPPPAVAEPVDPLPGWNDGKTKRAILEFVAAVTRPGGPDFVPPEERVAVFDHDGTLACEQPLLAGLFVVEQVRALVADRPELAVEEPFATLLAGDVEFLRRLGRRFFADLAAAVAEGVSAESLEARAREFLATARHPLFDVPLAEVTYEPMKELVALLQQSGFTVWICTGSDAHFIRPAAEQWYGIRREHVIGSRSRATLRGGGDDAVLEIVLLPEIDLLNEGAAKPVAIASHVGRRPIVAVGNAGGGGDVEMLRWSQGAGGRSLQLLVVHDDDRRDIAYAEPTRTSLAAAERHGWHVASVSTDWARVFGRPLVRGAPAPATENGADDAAASAPPPPSGPDAAEDVSGRDSADESGSG